MCSHCDRCISINHFFMSFLFERAAATPLPFFGRQDTDQGKDREKMEIKLNIYKGKKIEKTYTATSYDLMYGTVEDFINIIDVDKINDEIAVAGMIVKGFGQVKPLLMDVFEGLTEEELKNTKIKELVTVIIELGKGVLEDFGYMIDPKNSKRA